MTAVLTEQFESRAETVEDDSPTAERVYICEHAADEEVAKATFESLGAKFHGLLKRTTYDVDRLTETAFKITAKYERAPVVTVGPKSSPSFDISSSSRHIENSIRTLMALGPEANASRVGLPNPIDFDGTTIKGADILESVFTLSISQTLPSWAVTNDYMATIDSMVGCVNERGFAFVGDATFLGWPYGCVLFLGASGSRKENYDWEVTYKFAIKRQVPEEKIGDITVPPRPGWAYRSIEWADKKEILQGQWVDGHQPFRIVRKAVAVYVEQVFPETALELLGVEGF